MKIRTALTLRYTGITAAVFFVFIATIYYVNEQTRSTTFFRDLKSEAVTKAHLFLSNGVDTKTMQSIYLNNKKFIDEVEVAVYDSSGKILYHDALQNDIIKETPEMFDHIAHEKEIEFYVHGYQAVGILYPFNGHHYLITAAAYDGYGYAQQRMLEKALALLFIGGLTLLLIVGHQFARITLKPLREIIKETETMTSPSDIDRRLPVRNEKDELGELSLSFNALLDRLKRSFTAQRMFVSNVSHELRTPMAALSAELDLALQKERTPEKYQEAITRALQDAGRVNELINGLLNLAKADYDPELIQQEEVRMDEALLDAMELVMRAHPEYHVEPLFAQEDDDDERLLTVKGNHYLLTTALVNLMENNCKYSKNHTSVIQISYWQQWVVIRLSDNGIGMNQTDKENLFRLFYRGANSNLVGGHGIGMTLTQKIVELHNGEIKVASQEGEGTTYILKLPHI
jgi:signal transduction histidine kinase